MNARSPARDEGEEKGAEAAGGPGALLPERKRQAYLWGGAVLACVALVTAALNVVLPIPQYQKVSWFLVGFFGLSGLAALAVAKSAAPRATKVVE